MLAVASRVASTAMNPTASKLDVTFRVIILHGKKYSMLLAVAYSLLVITVMPSDSRNSSWISPRGGSAAPSLIVAKTYVVGWRVVVSVDNNLAREVSPGSFMSVVIFRVGRAKRIEF